jgi:GNAT superfamily N-acetyltransferase
MPREIQVRRAEPDDAAAIAKALFESFAQYRTLYTPEGFAATTPTTGAVLIRMKEGPVWIAFCENEVAGSVAAVIRAGSVYMRGMCVVPHVRRAGAGAQLLKQVEHWAAEQKCSRVFLSTTPFLHDAIRLYEKHGFQRSDEGDHDLFGTPLFTMEKPISSKD